MHTVVLTIIIFASAANQELTTSIELSDMVICRQLADRWSSYREGLIRVVSTTCEPRNEFAAPPGATSKPPL